MNKHYISSKIRCDARFLWNRKASCYIMLEKFVGYLLNIVHGNWMMRLKLLLQISTTELLRLHARRCLDDNVRRSDTILGECDWKQDRGQRWRERSWSAENVYTEERYGFSLWKRPTCCYVQESRCSGSGNTAPPLLCVELGRLINIHHRISGLPSIVCTVTLSVSLFLSTNRPTWRLLMIVPAEWSLVMGIMKKRATWLAS